MATTHVKIAPDVSIRRWVHSGGGFYRRNSYRAFPLPDEEYEFLQDLFIARKVDKEDSIVKALLENRLIIECGPEDKSSDWSGPHLIPNLHFRTITWAITGKCNYNCKHCFMAKDNERLVDEWSLEDALDLIEQAEKAGICEFILTGGEPFLYPHLLEVVKAIYDHNMFLSAFNTNAAFLTDEMLDKLTATLGDHPKPQLKVSFDGLGCHDWLRGQKGAEQATIDGIKRALAHGYDVRVQYCVHAKNVHVLNETVDFLDELGVQEIRIIRVAESVRWQENKDDAGIYYTEYYDAMLDFTRNFIEKPHNIQVSIWCMYDLYPKSKMYVLRLEQDPSIPDDRFYACGDCRMGIAVASNGEVWPCHVVSGTFEANNIHLGNLHKTPLWELLYESPVTKYACLKAHEMAKDIEECEKCKYWKRCRMGACTAVMMSVKLVEHAKGAPAACTYYKGGYSEKFKEVFNGWREMKNY